MKTNLNDLYANWFKASEEAKPEAWERLGEDLYHYIPLVINRQFPEWWAYLQEDGTGEALSKVLAGIHTFDPTKGDFKKWVYGVTVNMCIDMLRQRRHRHEIQYFGHEDRVVNEGYGAKLALAKLREGLTEEENELIDYKLDGVSSENIAVNMDKAEQTIKNKWGLLQEKLRTLRGGEES